MNNILIKASKRYLLLTLFYFTCFLLINTNSAKAQYDQLFNYLYENKIDSALYHLNSELYSKIPNKNYKELVQLCNKDSVFYKYEKYFGSNEFSVPSYLIFDIVKNSLTLPPSGKMVDFLFVRDFKTVPDHLRNSGEFDAASQSNTLLEKYIKSCKDSKESIELALLYTDYHRFLMLGINGSPTNSDKEKMRVASNRALALGDTNLFLMLSEPFLELFIIEQDLRGYIQNAERILDTVHYNYELEGSFIAIANGLAVAYCYTRVENEKSFAIIKELLRNVGPNVHNYEAVALYCTMFDKNDSHIKDFFKLFAVDNIMDMADTMFFRIRDAAYENDLINYHISSSRMLAHHGYTESALKVMDSAFRLTSKVYSKELSEKLAFQKVKDALAEKELEYAEERFIAKQNKIILISIIVALLVIGLVVFVAYKRQRKLVVEIEYQKNRLQAALSDNQLLLKEVHHRVKNNLQVVSSLLDMQFEDIEDLNIQSIVNESNNRVRSMALIHKKLYENESLNVDFEVYAKDLLHELTFVFKRQNVTVNFDFKLPALFDIDMAIPLGLLLNELVTNSLKYGLTNAQPTIEISLEKEGENALLLKVCDNGEGLKKVDFSQTKSLGLHLVKRLSEQLGGNANYVFRNGSCFEIRFAAHSFRDKLI